MRYYDDYVTFEQAKILKEKGFPQEWYQELVYFTSTKQNQKIGDSRFLEGEDVYEAEYSDWVTAPTLSLAQKWLREEKKIYIVIDVVRFHEAEEDSWMPLYKGRLLNGWSSDTSDSYKDVLSACIDEALNLI